MSASLFSALEVQLYVRIAAAASDPNDAVRKVEFDAAVTAWGTSNHAAASVVNTDSLTHSVAGQAFTLTVRRKTSSLGGTEGLIGSGANGLFVTLGTGANEAAAGSHTHTAATTGTAGFLSASDKTKLDGIAAGATAITLAGSGSAGTAAKSDHGHDAATTSVPGFMSAADKIKLDGLSGDDEAVRDAIAAILTNTNSLTFAYIDDGANAGTLSATVRRKAASLLAAEGLITETADGLVVTLGTAANQAAAGDHTHGNASESVAGFMSAADKAALNSLNTNTDWRPSVNTKADLPLNVDPPGVSRLVRAEKRVYASIANIGFVDDQWAPVVGSTSKFSQRIGNGVLTTIDVEHGLASEHVLAGVREYSGVRESLGVAWRIVDENTVRFLFTDPPASSGVIATIFA